MLERGIKNKPRPLLDMKARMADIRQMHGEVSEIPGSRKQGIHEYCDDFIEVVASFLDKLEIFPAHMVWECISEILPGNLSREANFILRDVTPEKYRKVFLQGTDLFNFGRDRYFYIPLTRDEFIEKFDRYFQNERLDKVFGIPVRPGFSFFNLPVFSQNESMPRWLVTFMYRLEDADWINSGDLFEFMEFVSHQIGLAWDKLQESITYQLLGIIDYDLGWSQKTRSDSTLDQLGIIARILARWINVEWCAFFMVDGRKNTLKLETANIDPGIRINYSLSDSSDILVNCFTTGDSLRLIGRESLEEIVTAEKMKDIEKGIRTAEKKRKYKAGKHFFTPYIFFEHALFLPIAFGGRSMGVMTLFCAKNITDPTKLDKTSYTTRPFSQVETYLLGKVLRNVINVFVSHDAVQRRMRDIRAAISRVIAPIRNSLSITRPFVGDAPIDEITVQRLSEKINFAHALSSISAQYAANFERLLDIDTHGISPGKEQIPDLRKFLIDLAKLYTPVIRPKCIHVNVTGDTPDGISIYVDRDLFFLALLNVIDNAVKFSFDPEDRPKYDLQHKPASNEDIENVLIRAWQDEKDVFITVGNCGVEIPEEEKKHIFDRDFRGGYTHSSSTGTGIGLYLVKKIINLHDGDIELVPGFSAFNTVFKIRVPGGMIHANPGGVDGKNGN